jgi:hypothetical protein
MNRTHLAIAAVIAAIAIVLTRPIGASQLRPPAQWEYLVSESGPGINERVQSKWNADGEKGWELVALHSHQANGTTESVYAVFRRPKK